MKNKFKTLITIVGTITVLGSQAQQPNFEWAKAFNGDADSEGKSITTDASGNVYTTGNYMGTVDFDPGPGTFTMSSVQGNRDVFVTKMDALGNLIWARSMGGSNNDQGYSIVVDATGNVYVCGRHYSSDFNPGANNFTLSTNGSDDMFISKFNSSGTLQWARGFGSSGFDAAFGLTVDANGNTFFTGYFSGTVDFDPGPVIYNLSSVGLYDIFIYKMDASGNLVWVNSFGSNGTGSGSDITLDANGNVYTCGIFSNTVDFDPGPGTGTLVAPSGSGMYVAKYSSSGSYIWARSFNGNSGFKTIKGIAVDVNNNVFTVGSFNVTMDFDPGPSVFTITPIGIDIFVHKLDNNGNFVWAKSMSGPNQDHGNDIATDAAGNVYSTGLFAGIVDFDPGPGTYTINSPAGDDVFVNKLDGSGNFIFAYSFGDNNSDQSNSINYNAGSIYLTGIFSGVVDFNPGAGTHTLSTSPSIYDAFVHKMSQCFAPATPSNLTLPSNAKACSGSTLVLMAMSGTASINWYGSATSTNAIHSGTSFATASTLAVGSYTYYAEAQSCTLSPARTPISFTVFANPVVSIVGSTIICTGETTTLSVSGAANYSWNTGSSSPFITVSPTINTTYTVNGLDANNCSGSSMITVNVDNCLGIKNKQEIKPVSVLMYPNPANSILNIETEWYDQNSHIIIANALGEVITREELKDRNTTVNLQSFANGIYFIRITVDNKVIDTQKIIKQ